jgi:hypothetical protein
MRLWLVRLLIRLATWLAPEPEVEYDRQLEVNLTPQDVVMNGPITQLMPGEPGNMPDYSTMVPTERSYGVYR